MTGWRIKDFHSADMDAILHLWEESRSAGVEPVYALSEVLASCQKDHAVVAVHGETVVGTAVARAAHDQGWIVFFAIDEAWRNQGIGSALLAAIEGRMAPHGLTKLSTLVPDAEQRVDALLNSGFHDRKHLRYFERDIPVQRQEMGLLSELGGRLMPRNLWSNVGGMQREKELLERRLVLPLANPDLADQYGVVPPRAVMLFGPPGTGKTTFAKAIASRLEWPFVEVFPSRLATDSKGLAGALRETFLEIAELEHAVVFIDEVEEIAAQRQGEPPSPLQGVTNELLKIIPAFREQPGRLLVCATNFIRALDTAFLRHGRFDYVIPIGLPDSAARHAIWQRYIPSEVAADIDLARLVDTSDGFSPADIEFAARKASQRALEQAVFGGADSGTPAPGPSSDDYLKAIAETRTTVSASVAQEFREDIERIARL
ncbi:bifunctional GNAT family N-acetyltransferase/ATP-binding protein [Arthrobacter sp. 260]|uniref:ATP-binding protein n=1 Tax=Arthrobacter sp. 260 TaxID=2735314 RepID=UPI001492E644|nr:bifunctional GNAT family N-acetyltransferase/ATP-binding protein [Arthrobacter sp. 260]NOJ59917.1 GNAT family N-acetyltransferase [Arthrobacter sp. 260]